MEKLQVVISTTTDSSIYDGAWMNVADGVWNRVFMSCCRALWKVGALLNIWTTLSGGEIQSTQSCQVYTVSQQIPARGSGVALKSYCYCGGVLDLMAYVENLAYHKAVTVHYMNGSNWSAPRSALGLGYVSAVDSTWELWNANAPVYFDSLTRLLNLTYVEIASKQIFAQQLDIPVVASGKTIHVAAVFPTPYAQPAGLADDITTWLAVSANSQIASCKSYMLANINSPGAANGTVVASTSVENPNYHYNWVRDAALTMDVVVDLYTAATSPTARSAYEEILFQYAQARATEQNDKNLATGLGEPKFELNNTVFAGPWGRPQNDGPAESAATLLDFASAYLANGGDVETVKSKIWDSNNFEAQAPVVKDLLYVATNWSSQSFDLWEEESADHFFNRLVSHRALAMGAKFASDINDTDTANTLSIAADAVVASLPPFWDPNRGLIVYEVGPVLLNKTSYKDIAVVLAVLHGYNDDGIYSYSDHRLLATAFQIATSFLDVYPVAKVTTDSSGATLGIPVGRYPEDVYTGTGTAPDGGNPWYLATAAMAELFYKVALEFQSFDQIAVDDTSLPFWTYFAPSASLVSGQTYTSDSAPFGLAISALEGWADAFMRRIKFHVPGDMRFAEEYDRNTGDEMGAQDLTWSNAAVLTAAFARAKLRGDGGYAADVANLGF